MTFADQEALAVARAIIKGDIGFLPLAGHRLALLDAADALAKIEKLRQAGLLDKTWDPDQWGYDVEKGQFERGLSQWRPDERKTTFQYSRGTPRELLIRGVPEKYTQPIFRNLLYAYIDMVEVGMRVARACDELLPGYGFAASCERAAARDMHALRILAYAPRVSKEELAAFSHRDRSFLSLTPNGSGPGFFIGHEKGGEIPVIIPDDHVAIFAGRKFTEMTGGKVKALWHGTREVRELEPDGRRGSVLFLHTDMKLTIGT